MSNLTGPQKAALAKIEAEARADLDARFPGDGVVTLTSEHGNKGTLDALIRKGVLVVVGTETKAYEVQRNFGRDAPRRRSYEIVRVRIA